MSRMTTFTDEDMYRITLRLHFGMKCPICKRRWVKYLPFTQPRLRHKKTCAYALQVLRDQS